MILDVCCGSRMFYFDKNSPDVIYCDIRDEDHILCDGRKLGVHPNIICDFKELPFGDNKFDMVIFDPPHLKSVGENGWQYKKYGKLEKNWQEDIKNAMDECFRVIKFGGSVVFKWNEIQIKIREILSAIADINQYLVTLQLKTSKLIG